MCVCLFSIIVTVNDVYFLPFKRTVSHFALALVKFDTLIGALDGAAALSLVIRWQTHSLAAHIFRPITSLLLVNTSLSSF